MNYSAQELGPCPSYSPYSSWSPWRLECCHPRLTLPPYAYSLELPMEILFFLKCSPLLALATAFSIRPSISTSCLARLLLIPRYLECRARFGREDEENEKSLWTLKVLKTASIPLLPASYRAVHSCPQVSPAWLCIMPQMLYSAIVLGEITLLPRWFIFPTWP